MKTKAGSNTEQIGRLPDRGDGILQNRYRRIRGKLQLQSKSQGMQYTVR